MRLHVVGLPHTNLTSQFSWCAYTQKVVKFAKMMTNAGCEVITYANGPADIAGKYVAVTDTQFAPYFVPDFEPTEYLFSHFNNQAIAAVLEHIAGDDIVCIIGGWAQEPIGRALAHWPVVEFGIGYTGVFARYKVFESYAWQHHVMGIRRPNQWQEGAEYDTVIPNFFEPDDFAIGEKSYYAYLGRITASKGVEIAVSVATELGIPLKIAGRIEEEADSGYVEHLKGDIEYVGNLEPEDRKDFLAQAIGVFCPTRFIDPFCGVHIEAMLSGAAVYAPDWGVFTETLTNGINGWRCRTTQDYIDHLDDIALDPEAIRHEAIRKYSLEAIAPRYLDYFGRL